MRCFNCGWDNPNASQICQKCGQPLRNGENSNSQSPGLTNFERESRPTQINSVEPTPKKTVLNVDFRANKSRKTNRFPVKNEVESHPNSGCGKCGYPVAPGFDVCPNCGSPVVEGKKGDNEMTASKEPVHRPTMRGAIKNVTVEESVPKCCLKTIIEDYEKAEVIVNNYCGESIDLSRENTEPENRTITQKCQARLVFEDGKWYIEDKSEMLTTFVYVSRRMPLNNGDIIVLGNRRFKFEEE